ncbi:MAG: PBSX family phage terminase large subunit [Oscillospiraceae bacterium]|nr:PBSX family phage terminase large subunit [Oscillospiraceae bacterium]MCI9308320.1 PBSX family phage terminase large subunit [Oscillospiraceae bacterium]
MRALGFSPKQRQVLDWWRRDGFDAVICDGAVRSGKTFALSVSFFLWAMARFHHQRFGLCAASINGARRNLLGQARPVLERIGFRWEEKVSRNEVTVRGGGRENVFYLYGGGDEGSYASIQGVTLAGVLLDEVGLMPRSFVEQAAARCSVAGGRLWFSCNPAGPEHWFYKEWICRAGEKQTLYLRFSMEDNPALSPQVRQRYERMFQGAFYRRYVLGEWTAAEGLVYDFFRAEDMPQAPEGPFSRWRISCDYGTRNPASFGLWGELGGVWYRVREAYYDARERGRQKTDGEYAEDLRELAGGRCIESVIVDPSAASFMETLRREGWRVRKADNRVLEGIRRTAQALKDGRIVICRECRAAAREFGLYRWEEGGEDRVRKESDHAMDDIRYFVMAMDRGGGSAARFVERDAF